jgi:hypothetical protein
VSYFFLEWAGGEISMARRLTDFGQVFFLGAILLLCVFPAFAASAQSAPPAESPALESPPPGLIILVWDLEESPARVTLTFARPIDHRSLEQSIAGLGRVQGWQIWNIKINDEEFATDKQIQTSASFNCQGIVDRPSGKLGLEPLLEAFGAEGNFRVVFVVPGMANFTGPGAFSNDRLEVQLSGSEGIYEYQVQPIPGAKLGPPLPSARQGALLRIGLVLLILMLSGGLVVVLVWLWYGMKSKALTDKRGERGNGH